MNNDFNIALAQDKKPYWVWGPLAFSLFYFLPLFFNFAYFWPTKLLFVIALYALFVYCYKEACTKPGEKALVPVIAIISLATFGTAITPGTQALFGFAAYFLGFNFSFNKGFFGLWVTLGCIVATAFFNSYVDVYFLVPATIVSVGLFFLGQAERKDRIYRAKEEKSQQQIEQLATIAERERIARDLHDLVGHSLSSIALKAELAHKLMEKSQFDNAAQQIEEVATLSRTTLAEVRHAVSGLKEVNLTGQITKLVSNLKSNGFHVNRVVDIGELSPQVESQLVLMLTELVTNILRHSKGDSVEIVLEQKEGLRLHIQDNGQCKTLNEGNGLQGIKERCQQIGANCDIKCDDGFAVSITCKDV
ncbi:sensor histidine kinase [Thalassotalea eurytherma]|uniref:Two-component sensor histidine kinase n=1 Tax=Thalassotalea eurytherma TaxID=1144278 RepID=A0ABQ6H5I6_9GAMM|nr:sensor histidine kinase [Thalassotalea eurytherma]GLX83411.1 two-component sensor histidine kinase [Thalassotalea eurytherma]